MHDHNNNDNKDGGHKGVMWMMIPCLLLLGILFFGGDKLFSSGYLWPILIGVFVVAHIWMMFKGHGKHNDTNKDGKMSVSGEPETGDGDNKHKHGGCCH